VTDDFLAAHSGAFGYTSGAITFILPGFPWGKRWGYNGESKRPWR